MPDDAKGRSMPTEPLRSAADPEPVASGRPLDSDRRVTSLDARRKESNVARLPGVVSPGRGPAPGGEPAEHGDAPGTGDSSPSGEAPAGRAESRRHAAEPLSEEEKASVRAARRQQALESREPLSDEEKATMRAARRQALEVFLDPSATGVAPSDPAVPGRGATESAPEEGAAARAARGQSSLEPVVDTPATGEAASDPAMSRRKPLSDEEKASARAARRQQAIEALGRVPPDGDDHPESRALAPGVALAGSDITMRNDGGTRRPRARTKPPRGVGPLEVDLPPLPVRTPRKRGGAFFSFLVLVVLPVCVSAVYFLFMASDQYVSEFKFAVRDAKSAAQGNTTSSLAEIATVAGTGPNTLESYMVIEYLKSEAALQELQKRIDIRKMYSRPEIDFVGRFDTSKSIESFTAYWNRRITTQYDQITGIGQARVRAYTPQDAYLIATTLVTMSEELINELANRPKRDAVRSAESDVKKMDDRLKDVSARLTAYRNTEQVIEPTANVVTSNIQLAQSLRALLVQYQTELSGLKRQNLDAKAPIVLVLQNRIKATRDQLAAVEAEVGGTRDGANVLSKVMGDYERLDLERQFATDSVKAAMTTLDQARSSTVFQNMYVTPFVVPNMPQASIYPQRLLFIGVTILACLLFWTAGLLFFRSVREHIV